MNEIQPFRPLQAPVAVALSAFAIIALTELHSLDPDSTSFSIDSFNALSAVVFWIVSAGVVTYNSPQAQGATSAVFTVAALVGEIMPADSEHRRSTLSEISPILWILAGIMCGSAAATCTTISRTSKHHSTLSITDQLLGRIAVAVLASLLASAPLVSTSPSRLWATPGQTSMSIITFLCGFAMTSLAGMAPFISWIYLAITLGRYYTFDDAEAARTYLIEVLPIPLLAVSATAGLITMYHYKKPRPITSSQSTDSQISPQGKDTHEE